MQALYFGVRGAVSRASGRASVLPGDCTFRVVGVCKIIAALAETYRKFG